MQKSADNDSRVIGSRLTLAKFRQVDGMAGFSILIEL
jgi:hypothetical protein